MLRRRLWLLVAALAAASCAPRVSGAAVPADARDIDATSAASSTSVAAPPSPSPTTDPPRATTITVALAGDVHGERQIAHLLANGETPLASVAAHLSAADIAIVNLETPVGRGGSPQDKEYVFLAPPALLAALHDAGIDVVSLGNNHALDHGTSGLLETIDHAQRVGLSVVGAGAHASDAYLPATVVARGRTVAVIGLSRVVPVGWAATSTRAGVATAYDERAALDAVASAAAHADHVIVTIHWGVEGATCPTSEQIGLARRLHDAGADIVAGHHPHVLQGISAENGVLTAYSLGNFVWYHGLPPTGTTGVLEVSLSDDGVDSWRFHAAAIDASGSPRLLTGDAATDVERSVRSRAPSGAVCAAAG